MSFDDGGNQPMTLQERLREWPTLETVELFATSDLMLEAADEFDRLARELQAAPTWQAFFDKYALGPKEMPSCLVCGKNAIPWPPAIQHAELPGIVVCHSCRDASRQLAGVRAGTHVIVPRVAPQEAVDAMRQGWHQNDSWQGIYNRAMLAAPPADPNSEGE